MINYFIELFGGYIDPIGAWLLDGGFVLLLTYFFTYLATKNKKKRWMMEGKEEDIESLIVTIINLKNVTLGLLDMFVLVFSTSKGITEEVRTQLFAKLDVMKQEYGAKIDAQILDMIALVRVQKKKAAEKIKAGIETSQGEANSFIDELAKKANEIVQKELNKD